MPTMTDPKMTEQTRNFIANGLKIRLTPGNLDPVKTHAFAFQNAISQIPDRIISELIKQPNAKIRVQLLKPKTDEHYNARSNKRKPA